MYKFNWLCLILVITFCTSCTNSSGRYTKGGAAAAGAGIGGVAGAGGGALIGAVISRGDIAASALLGTAIGVPVGAAIGVYYLTAVEDKEIRENQMIIDYNADLIKRREQKIKQLKVLSNDESKKLEADPELKQEVFTGSTLGNARR